MAVSIIMSAFNAEKYISEAIESVLNQTYKDFEFIIINDGSTDNTGKIIKKYSKLDSRIKYFEQENKGMGESLNFALSLCSNELVARIDADDLMIPNRIERQINFFKKHPEYSVVATFVKYINEKGEIIGGKKSKLTSWNIIEEEYKSNKLVGFHHPSVMYKKSNILEVGGYRREYWPADDIDLWNRLLEKGFKIIVLPEFLTLYRISISSVTVSKSIETDMKKNFVKHNMLLRRKGLNEISWDEYINNLNKQKLYLRLNERRKNYVHFLYKNITIFYATKKYIKLILNSIILFLIGPIYFVKKILNISIWTKQN